MHVILFDIDGTLLHTGGAGRAALDLALVEAFSRPVEYEVSISGRTDRGIVGELFETHGIESSDENWHRFREAYLRNLAQIVPKKQGRVLDGVHDLLACLAERKDVSIGLLTGNVREGARIKLEHFRLYDRFPYGGFGDHHPDRSDVAREALAAAESHLGRSANLEKLWVIGDTLFDIRCARAIGAQIAAVATGTESLEMLAGENPDLLLSDLTDTAKISRKILNGG